MSAGQKVGSRRVGWLQRQQVRPRRVDPAPGTSWCERFCKPDVTLQTPFINAGITSNQMQNEAAPDLAFDVAKAMGQQFAQWQKTSPAFALNQASAFGFTDVFSPDELRLLAKRVQDGSLDKEHEQYGQNWQKMGLDQQAADRMSDFDEHQRANWKEISTAWDRDVEKLTPSLDRWSDAATKLAVGFLDKATTTVNDLTDAGDHPTPPGTAIPHAAQDDYPGRIREGEQRIGQWLQRHGLNDPFDGAGTDTPAGQTDNFTAAMRAITQIESHGDESATNPVTGAYGKYGLLPSTAKAAGLDPAHRDAEKERVVAESLLHHDLARFGRMDRALAAYNWGEGNLSRDIDGYKDKSGAWHAGHGDDWLKHAPAETQQYLLKAEQLYGVNFDAPVVDSAATPFDDSEALKKAANVDRLNSDPQIVPFDSVDQQAVDAQPQTRVRADKDTETETMTARLMRGLGMIGSAIGEGGGSQFRSPDAPARTANPTPQQFNIELKVQAPAGSDVSVTGASLAQ